MQAPARGGGGKSKARAVGEDDEADEEGGGAGGEGDSDADGGEEDGDEAFAWAAHREACLDVLLRAMALDFRRMYPMGAPEEEYVAAICKTFNRVLAVPSAMKDKGTRRAALEVRGCC